MKQKDILASGITALVLAIAGTFDWSPAATDSTSPLVTIPPPAPDQRYVICETYPPGYPGSQVETITNPLFKSLAYSSGSNYPTRLLPEYMKFAGDPMGYARFDIHMAREAGIDAFCFGDISYGYHTQFTEAFWDYWKAAREDGTFKLVPYTLLLNKGAWGETPWMRFQKTWPLLIKDYRDVFLQIDGKYVIHSWTSDPTSPGLTPDAEVDAVLAGLGGPEKVFLIQQTSYLANLTPVAGFDGGQYNNPIVEQLKKNIKKYANAMTQFQEESYGDLPAAETALTNVSRELGKEFVSPIMQGFYQSRWQFRNDYWPGGRINEKLGFAGCYYQWRHAIDAHARIAYITTWNDITEDHSVMPEEIHGYAFYELTKYFIKWFKSGTKPPVEKEQVLMFHHPQLTEKTLQTPPGAFVAGRYNNSSTPPTDYIGVVVMLKSPATITVEMGVSSTGIPNTRLAIRNFPAGTNFWLIYHPLINASQSAIPDIDSSKGFSKDSHPVYPQEKDDFFVTKLNQSLEDRELFLSIDRGGQNIGYYTSHRAIVGAAAAGNLGTVGDVFEVSQDK